MAITFATFRTLTVNHSVIADADDEFIVWSLVPGMIVRELVFIPGPHSTSQMKYGLGARWSSTAIRSRDEFAALPNRLIGPVSGAPIAETFQPFSTAADAAAVFNIPIFSIAEVGFNYLCVQIFQSASFTEPVMVGIVPGSPSDLEAIRGAKAVGRL